MSDVPSQTAAWSPTIPLRPSLALNVQVAGESLGNGFKQRQWLIQRGSEFIQVTELLYHIAEHLDGHHTCAEIAAALTDKTEWLIEPEDVEHLIRSKLLPLNLVADHADTHTNREPLNTPSPLSVRMRMRVIGPRVLRPATQILQHLYRPPILLPLVGAAVAAHWWLYHLHGVLDGIRDTFYTPGGLALVIATVLMAGFFHELGHASALRYGGGEARAMGFGLYLVYPAFYTDATDSYRLDRWPRVRVDLGGVYFHLVFCLGLFGISLLMGKQLFLFAVVLINLDMVRQFIPFVRLDGYWLLADLTGLPDFFSLMGPFLMNLLPGRSSASASLPELKRWVNVVFAVYTLGTIPVLAYLFFLLVRNLPLLTIQSWRGLLMQMHSLSEALSTDYWAAIGISLNVLFLAIPVVGSLLLLVSAIAICARYFTDWSGGTSLRHTVAVAVAAGCLAGTAALWHSELPELRSALNTPYMAEAPDKVLSQSQVVTGTLTTLKADVEGAIGGTTFSGKIVLRRPNFAFVEVHGAGDLGDFRVISDGKKVFTFFPEDNSVSEIPPGANGQNIQVYLIEQVQHFFRPSLMTSRKARGHERQLEKETLDGATYDVAVLQDVVGPQTLVRRWYISPSDKLVHRVVTITQRKGSEYSVSWCQLSNIRENEAIRDSTFSWSPPPSARPLGIPASVTAALGNVGRQ